MASPASRAASCSPSCERRGWSSEAVKFVSGYNLTKAAGVSGIYFYSEAEVLETNADDFLPIALRDGLLVVGSCPNGDPVAVDVRDRLRVAGYVGHETMWQAASVHEVFAVVAPGIEALAAELLDTVPGAVPLDYYEAVDRGSQSA
ncbi:MAG: hypothetical protein ACYC3X_31435 [Pirellulaceae bacterium]